MVAAKAAADIDDSIRRKRIRLTFSLGTAGKPAVASEGVKKNLSVPGQMAKGAQLSNWWALLFFCKNWRMGKLWAAQQ